eukprot:scaffold4484_cov170-Amphora_coffeaeformis.AAC.9
MYDTIRFEIVQQQRLPGCSLVAGRRGKPSSRSLLSSTPPLFVIRPGAATGAPVPPPAPASSSAAGGRGGGRGRGGRGGRGGRHVIQQGQAFFTANIPPSSSGGAKGSAGGKSGGGSGVAASVARRIQGAAGEGGRAGSGGSLLRRNQNESQEEIVGMLDEAIGGAVPEGVKSTPKLLSGNRDESGNSKYGGTNNETEEAATPPPASAFEYDSDSDLEIHTPVHVQGITMPTKNPLTLPFPKAKFPPGVGASIQLEQTQPSTGEPQQDMAAISAPLSPFASLADIDDLEEENNSWFLLQMPTRLPALHGAQLGEGGNNNTGGSTNETAKQLATSDVATVPLRNDCFDNSLVKAASGRIGKFVVYESGKTVLVLNGQDGREYRLNVAEGLSCSFRQQAVVIDDTTKEFIPLGDVSKTAVVTPDVETAFIGTR